MKPGKPVTRTMHLMNKTTTANARRLGFCLLAVGFLAAACGTGSAGDSPDIPRISV